MINEPMSNSGLTLCIDLNNLSTYVCLFEIRKLVDDFGLEVHCLPLIKSPAIQPPREGEDPLAQYKARRAAAREKHARRELERNCSYLDITTDQGCREFDSTCVSAGLLWLEETGATAADYWRYIQTVFTSAFKDNQPVESAAEVSALLDLSRSDRHGFSDFLKGNELARLQEMLLESGVFESPTIIYEGERYLGRQHHPLLRWILGGRKGSPPI